MKRTAFALAIASHSPVRELAGAVVAEVLIEAARAEFPAARTAVMEKMVKFWTELADAAKELVILRYPVTPSDGGPPFHLLATPLEIYRAQGHRRLDTRSYAAKCSTCMWGCVMPTEMIIDHWNRSRGPDNTRWRMEMFCYGPDECPVYKPGPNRKVPGHRGMVHEDDGNSRS